MIRLQFEETLYPPTNQVSNLNYVYDTNGNVKQNSLSMNFSWNAAGQPITVSGVGATYDALGRLVETNNSGSYTQYIYRPSGDKLGAVSVSNGVA
jgi:YD repeat-containing protein